MKDKLRALFAGKGVLLVAAVLALNGFGFLFMAAVLHWQQGRPGYMVMWIVGIVVLALALRPADKIHQQMNQLSSLQGKTKR